MNDPLGRPADAPANQETKRAEQQQTVDHGSVIVRRRPRVRWSDAAGVHELTVEGRLVVGSAPGTGIVLPDRTVSRLHAELEPRDDGLWVRDLGSRNGTYIEEVRVDAGRVPPGGKLRLGATTLVTSYEAAPTPVAIWTGDRFGPLVGRSEIMRELFARLAKMAPTDSSVLVQGETGTGKELVARAIHEASPRAGQPFVIVDCAALPENLLEAELFGHTKGAFTGAINARPGAIEAAEGGTVFLDEIGELPLSVQPKLLRVLESRQVRRVGETTHRMVDVRFICATNRDLKTMVNANAFREDLYFRLAVLVVSLPSLREHADDIPLLVDHLIPGGLDALTPETMRELVTKPWLGNVRELRNFLERAHALGAREALAMSSEQRAAAASAGVAPPPAAPADAAEWVPVSLARSYKAVREEWLDWLEREYFRRLLVRHDRNVAEAAREAGVDRTYVYRLIRRHDL